MEVRATGSRVQLLVEDHGPGIPRQVRRAVFADATTDLTEAPRPHAGLGLHVAVALVRQQNGTIELTDRVGGGALFVIEAPRGGRADGLGLPAAGATGRGGRVTTRVLVLDDHELLAQSVSFLAAGSGFRRRPLPLADYDTLVDQVRADPPDVILLDLQLGGEVLSPEARRLLLTELRVHRAEQKASRMPFERLSPHERQVLRALCDGKSVTAIATEWVTSIATVRAQVRAVLAKLGAGSQLEAVAEANRCGWYAEPHPTELHLHQA